jgi:hypothetical protein
MGKINGLSAVPFRQGNGSPIPLKNTGCLLLAVPFLRGKLAVLFRMWLSLVRRSKLVYRFSYSLFRPWNKILPVCLLQLLISCNILLNVTTKSSRLDISSECSIYVKEAIRAGRHFLWHIQSLSASPCLFPFAHVPPIRFHLISPKSPFACILVKKQIGANVCRFAFSPSIILADGRWTPYVF